MSDNNFFTQEELNEHLAKAKREYKEKNENANKQAEEKAKVAEEASKLLEEEKAKAERLASEANRQRIAREFNLTPDLDEFLTAKDVDGLKSQAKKLSEKVGVATPPKSADPKEQKTEWHTKKGMF